MYVMLRRTEEQTPPVTAPLMSVLLRYHGNAINKPLLRLGRPLTIMRVWVPTHIYSYMYVSLLSNFELLTVGRKLTK
jgi:hypothetical protein